MIGIPPPLVLSDQIILPLLRNVLDILGYAAGERKPVAIRARNEPTEKGLPILDFGKTEDNNHQPLCGPGDLWKWTKNIDYRA